MLTKEQKKVHSEFRKYLRIKENIKGNMLNTLINATEESLPALIRKYMCKDFDCIYNEKYSIEELLSLSVRLKSDDEILAAYSGYISSKAIEAYIRFYANKVGIDLSAISMPKCSIKHNLKSNDVNCQMVEGRLTEIKVFRRQRNRAARQKCVEESGYTCYVCGFNFEKTYGEIGKGFIEVHHTKPLASYDDEHAIPQSELCALCSNCHSMVHRQREVTDVDKLKRMFDTGNSS